jgi:predicted metal-dependent peptidase
MHDLPRKIARSKVRLMLDKLSKGWGFYASVLYQMPMVEKSSLPTMATDGKSIFYNAEFTDALSEPELDGVKVHEAYNRILKHHLRMGKRDAELWNIACDYAINPIIIQSGLVLPEGALIDAKFKGMSAEKIYDLLKEDQGDDGNGGGGSGQPQPQEWGNVEDQGGDMSEDQIKSEEATINAQVVMAVNSMKTEAGKLPANIKEIIDEMKRSQIDWKDVLRRFVGGDQPEGYSYRRPNRRQWYLNEVVTPVSNKIGCGDIVVGIDTSGSVSSIELSHFLGELNAIAESSGAESVTIITCDYDVQDVVRYEKGDQIEDIVCKGRGGTRVMPVFDYIAENNINVDNFIYFTDMGIGDYPEHDVGYPILWVSSDMRGEEAPIGETTYLKVA